MKPLKQLTVKLFLSSLVLLAITFSNRKASAAPVSNSDSSGISDTENETSEELSEEELTFDNFKLKIRSFFLVDAPWINTLFKSYSNSAEINDLIDSAEEQVKIIPNKFLKIDENGKRQAFCYGAVRTVLQEKTLLPPSCTDSEIKDDKDRVDCFVSKRKREDINLSAYAVDAAEDLLNYGYINLLNDSRFKNLKHLLEENPIMAPRGALLVYKTVEGDHVPKNIHVAGHIEIKTEESGKDGYVSVGSKKKSIDQRPTYGKKVPEHRTLVGIMIKESLISVVPLASFVVN